MNDNVVMISLSSVASSPAPELVPHTGTMPAPNKSVTLHDVAQAAGVSVITASRALGNPALVSPATIERVQQAAAATGYIPNLLAGGLKSRRSNTIAALVPVISVPQFLPTIRALTDELDREGYQLLLGQIGYDRVREQALLDAMLGRRVDGIVVAGLLSTPSRKASAAAQSPTARLRQLDIPVVETWDLSTKPLDTVVGFSHRKVGRAVAEFFRTKGWQRVAIATADDERALQRRDGFVAAFGRDVPAYVLPAPSSMAAGRAALAELLRHELKLQAVFCSSDGLAEGVLTEARARGLRVPQQLAVCGFGDADFAAHLVPSLTTVQVDGAEIGRLAAQLIVKRCRGEAVPQRVVDVGFRVIERESTGGPVER